MQRSSFLVSFSTFSASCLTPLAVISSPIHFHLSLPTTISSPEMHNPFWSSLLRQRCFRCSLSFLLLTITSSAQNEGHGLQKRAAVEAFAPIGMSVSSSFGMPGGQMAVKGQSCSSRSTLFNAFLQSNVVENHCPIDDLMMFNGAAAIPLTGLHAWFTCLLSTTMRKSPAFSFCQPSLPGCCVSSC